MEKSQSEHGFIYLAAIVKDKGSKPEILTRTAQTTAVFTVKDIWNYKSVALSSVSRLMCSLVMNFNI